MFISLFHCHSSLTEWIVCERSQQMPRLDRGVDYIPFGNPKPGKEYERVEGCQFSDCCNSTVKFCPVRQDQLGETGMPFLITGQHRCFASHCSRALFKWGFIGFLSRSGYNYHTKLKLWQFTGRNIYTVRGIPLAHSGSRSRSFPSPIIPKKFQQWHSLPDPGFLSSTKTLANNSLCMLYDIVVTNFFFRPACYSEKNDSY